MAALANTVIEMLKCSVCLSVYRRPKLLPCSHTFCQECLRKMAAGVPGSGYVPCPLCRKEFRLPRNGVSDLPRLLLLEKLLEAHGHGEVHKNDVVEPASNTAFANKLQRLHDKAGDLAGELDYGKNDLKAWLEQVDKDYMEITAKVTKRCNDIRWVVIKYEKQLMKELEEIRVSNQGKVIQRLEKLKYDEKKLYALMSHIDLLSAANEDVEGAQSVKQGLVSFGQKWIDDAKKSLYARFDFIEVDFIPYSAEEFSMKHVGQLTRSDIAEKSCHPSDNNDDFGSIIDDDNGGNDDNASEENDDGNESNADSDITDYNHDEMSNQADISNDFTIGFRNVMQPVTLNQENAIQILTQNQENAIQLMTQNQENSAQLMTQNQENAAQLMTQNQVNTTQLMTHYLVQATQPVIREQVSATQHASNEQEVAAVTGHSGAAHHLHRNQRTMDEFLSRIGFRPVDNTVTFQRGDNPNN